MNTSRNSLVSKGRKRVVAIVLAVAVLAAIPLFALDTTISNEFWCTWNYVNPSPVTSQKAFADPFDSVVVSVGPYAPDVTETILGRTWTIHQSEAVRTFNSFAPVGAMLFLK